MNASRVQKIVWLTAAAILVAGAGLSVQTVGHIRGTGLRIERKLNDLEKLKMIETEVKRGETARQTIERMPARLAEPLLPLVQSQFAATKAEDCRETRHDLGSGWIVRQIEVSLHDVSFAAVMDLVRKAEAMDPPWRLAACTLRTSPGAPGAGQAVLQFEAVQRKE